MFRKNKKHIFAICGVLVIACCTSIIGFADAQKNYKIESRQNIEYIAAVNGEQISYSEYLDKLHVKQVSLGQSNLRSIDNDLLQEMITQEVVKQNAKQLGISVSKTEAEAEVRRTHELIQEMIESGNPEEQNQAEEVWYEYQEIIEKLGMTEEEYIRTYEVPAMQSILLNNKHYEKFLKQNVDQTMTHDQIVSAYEEYINDLLDKSDIIMNR